MAIAFFDLDRTLLAANSGKLWLKRELELGHVSRWQALQAGLWLFKYGLGFASLENAVRQAVGQLAGVQDEAVRGRASEFYEHHIRHHYRPRGIETVERHQRAGDRTALLTASFHSLADLVARELKLDAVLCNRFEVDAQGLYTGRTLGSICFGSGKLLHAREFAARESVPLSECTFYTDSYSDLPVLAAVGRPVAVNPDRRLRREAFRRGWPVVDWGGGI